VIRAVDAGGVKQVFDEAADLPRGERSAFLDGACNGDVQVRAQVESLLRAMEESRDFLSRVEAPEEVAAGLVEGEAPGDVIGRYELLELIGEGGFGSVFLAEQREPVRRRVALKIIKPGMDTRQVIARFEAERQALAMMDHPGVARALDAGATSRGRPFFVMELAPGEPITEFCEERGLGVRARLELFVQVCRAVQHAHSKGVIHRDLKPSNVLVGETAGGGGAAAKIIDFGIAKAVSGRLTDQTITGEQRPLLGTPEYMSPEQAGGAGVDTRSDIYSLGAMLYELLTRSPPLDRQWLRQAPWDEALRLIREDDPPRASVRLAASGADEARLARQVRGELDWIAAKCLQKEPARRYETASALAADIQRYLDGDPVLAVPPSRVYQARKFVARHRAEAVGGGLVAASLLLGLVGTATFAVRESRQRAAVEARAAELDRIAAFQGAMLSEIDPEIMGRRLREDLLAEAVEAWQRGRAGAKEVEARAAELERLLAGVNFTSAAIGSLDRNILHGALEAVEREFGGEPLVKARLLQTLATMLRELGLYERAEPPQTEALAIRRRLLAAGDRDLLASTNEMAMLLRRVGRLDEAEALYLEALAGRRRWLGAGDPDTLESINNMGVLRQAQGRLEEAQRHYAEALEGRRRVLGADHPDTMMTLYNMGLILQAQGELDEAALLLEQALRLRRANLGDDHPDTLASLNGLGGLRKAQGDLAGAEALYLEALAGRRRALGDDHPDTLVALNNLGALLQRREGREVDAERHLTRALAGFERVLGPDHERTLGALNNLGFAMGAQGRWVEAEGHFAEAVARAERSLGADHPGTQRLRENLVTARQSQ
jgi:tetratricopeptide (TPR) repeat protein/tRNA A-37 threonylcarbamoyl transferase component Bud32